MDLMMLHLHSNMFLLFRTMIHTDMIRILEFTFQYVSIISVNVDYVFTSAEEFTFQYVSIISGQSPDQ